MAEDQEDQPTTNLRGWLSTVYFSALAEGALGPLAARLGPRASIDEPRLGRVTGSAVTAQLEESAAWLKALGAKYTRVAVTAGVDRDVTEGTLAFDKDGAKLLLPVAVVAERRKGREVDVRVYYLTRAASQEPLPRAQIAAASPSAGLPSLLADYLAVLRTGDLGALLACFEEGGTLRDAAGRSHRKSDGALRAYFERATPWDALPGGYADDGRTCAFEYAIVRIGGVEVPPRAGLTILERGESGLFREARVYDEA